MYVDILDILCFRFVGVLEYFMWVLMSHYKFDIYTKQKKIDSDLVINR